MGWRESSDGLYCKLRRRIALGLASSSLSRSRSGKLRHRRCRSHASSDTMSLTDLPYPVFIEIISYLSPREIILCRRLSSDVLKALQGHNLCISLVLTHFPRALEGRTLRKYLDDGDSIALDNSDWAAVFATLARRYYHLATAVPRITSQIPMLQDADRLRGVTPWNRFLKLDDKTAPFHYWDPAWTCSTEDALLVYPGEDGAYHMRDLQTGLDVTVPFDLTTKIVRRVRLSHGILIFEWCEENAYHALNDKEMAHRHFATAYDVVSEGDIIAMPQYGDKQSSRSWSIAFRSEWKIHYLGLPLSHQDRFFSTHNKTHYAVYIWQPTRSPWGEDDPLERLIVWELGEPSSYKPSLDPSEAKRPKDYNGPRIVRRLINSQLDNWGIRQSDTPSLRGLVLDNETWDYHSNASNGHIFFIEEEHRWSAGPHSKQTTPRCHHVKTTGIPLIGDGPMWTDDCGGLTNGNYTMSPCWRGQRRRAYSLLMGEEEWPGRAPCWRHDDFPYLTVSEVNDVAAGVRISARHCFMMETMSVHMKPKLRIHGVESAVPWSDTSSSSSVASEKPDKNLGGGAQRRTAKKVRSSDGPEGREVQFDDTIWGQVMGNGVMVGDERWLIGEDGKGKITILYF